MSGSPTERPEAGGRLWVVSELYYPEETSTGYYMTKIAEGLAPDLDVKVICGQPTYSMRGTRAPSHEFHKNVEIFRAAGTTLNKDVIAFRLINMLTLGLSILVKAIRRFRPGDRILVVTTPPSMPFIVALAALARGAAYTLLIHDNYPELLIAVGKVRADSFFCRFNEFLNRWLYKNASSLVVVGRDMAESLTRKTNGLEPRIDTIPNWAELETVRPLPRNENTLLAELGLLDKFVVLYAGNIGRPNDVETIAQAAEKLLETSPIIHFVFIGAGAKRKWLETRIRERQLSNITLIDPRPRREQPVFLNACDIAVVSLVSKMWGVSVPSRTYNAIAAGKPLIALTEPNSEVDRMIKEDRLGWSVPPGDPDLLQEAILEAAHSTVLPAIAKRARRSAEEKYSVEVALKRYRASISGTLSE